LPEVPLLAGEGPQSEQADDDKEVEFYWVGSDARIAGTLVHRWLQILTDDPGGECSRAVTLRWLREAGMSSEAAEPIVSRVELAVSKMLDDQKGRWILAGEGHAELALSGVDGGDLVSVIIDRVRIDENGTHWIVDYKTSSHEGGDLDTFLEVEAERYRPQLQRYRAIYAEWSGEDVKCALYFPLLQSFVEVAV
jgi:ATP-dependent exoDNAse (exonuclease V) beta subunit